MSKPKSIKPGTYSASQFAASIGVTPRTVQLWFSKAKFCERTEFDYIMIGSQWIVTVHDEFLVSTLKC